MNRIKHLGLKRFDDGKDDFIRGIYIKRMSGPLGDAEETEKTLLVNNDLYGRLFLKFYNPTSFPEAEDIRDQMDVLVGEGIMLERRLNRLHLEQRLEVNRDSYDKAFGLYQQKNGALWKYQIGKTLRQLRDEGERIELQLNLPEDKA